MIHILGGDAYLRAAETLFAGFVLVGLPLYAYLATKRGDPTPPRAAAVVVRNILLVAVLVVFLKVEGVPPAAVGVVIDDPIRLFITTVLGTSFVVGVDIILTRALIRNPAARKQAIEQLNQQVPRGVSKSLGFVALVFTSAVWEEFAFRGVALNLGDFFRLPLIVSMLVASVLFGLQHMRAGLTAVFHTSLFGVIFFGIYILSGSLLPGIIAHIVGNLFVVFVTYRRITAGMSNSKVRHGL